MAMTDNPTNPTAEAEFEKWLVKQISVDGKPPENNPVNYFLIREAYLAATKAAEEREAGKLLKARESALASIERAKQRETELRESDPDSQPCCDSEERAQAEIAKLRMEMAYSLGTSHPEMYKSPDHLQAEKDLSAAQEKIAELEQEMVEAVGDIVSQCGVKDEEITALRSRCERLEGALEHIGEYWNKSENQTAMSDALWHILETVDAILSPKPEGR